MTPSTFRERLVLWLVCLVAHQQALICTSSIDSQEAAPSVGSSPVGSLWLSLRLSSLSLRESSTMFEDVALPSFPALQCSLSQAQESSGPRRLPCLSQSIALLPISHTHTHTHKLHLFLFSLACLPACMHLAQSLTHAHAHMHAGTLDQIVVVWAFTSRCTQCVSSRGSPE
jgi:hypothetical protein